MRASFRGQVLAEAPKSETIQIEGNVYFPPGAVMRHLLRESDTPYTCPWKGVSQYYDAVLEEGVAHDVGWSYPELLPSAIRAVGRDFSGYVAFSPKVTIEEFPSAGPEEVA
jgi:uncharacterized protein (DUF427 family)